MALTPAQLAVLKADILADPVFSQAAAGPDGAFVIAAGYNALASPDYIVWRTSVTEAEFTEQTSAEATNWDWTAYIARSQGERDGWRAMFAGSGAVNAARPNVRQGFADIFSGSQSNAPAQRTHCAAIAKRKASRVEKLFASGTGSFAAPATMAVEGPISYVDVQLARES